MFGYITICKENISKDGYNTFKSYYCGLCKATGKRCSQSARLGLSYDMTFLAMVLSAIDSKSPEIRNNRCILHPFRENRCVENDIQTDYAADMGVILTYLKLLDDWKDERSIKSLLTMILFKRGEVKAKKRYPKIYNKIRMCLDDLSNLEKEDCDEIDKTADCFARILKILFTPDFIEDKNDKRILGWLGYNIGRWIYVIDAYNDIEKDYKNKSYNTFISKNKGKTYKEIKEAVSEKLKVSLTFTLENAASAYNLLDIKRNKEVLDNIIYSSLKAKQDFILGENNESL